MKINKYFPFALLFFFFNTAGLPHGLLYTSILTPFFYIWIVRRTGTEPVLPFLLILTPYMIIHAVNGVDSKVYMVSLLNIICIYIFCVAFYVYLRSGARIERIFSRLLYINFFLCLVAIPFYFSSYSNLFWIEQVLTAGVKDFRRLNMFTYEASYYATLLVPLLFFYLSQIILGINKIPLWRLLVMLIVPFVLSFSLGVISAIIVSLTTVYLFYHRTLTKKKQVLVFLTGGSLLLLGFTLVLIIFFPNNTLFLRIHNISTGNDSSARGRTFEAFFLADMINQLKSPLFGIGWGQVKITGMTIIRTYYNYPEDYAINIPNASAETLAILGWSGLLLRILLEIILFFRTRVWTNYYRLFLFLFIFLYQFTGSFITNVAEYVIWILAFTNVFPQFDAISGRFNIPVPPPRQTIPARQMHTI